MLHHHTGSYYDEYRRKKGAEKVEGGKSHQIGGVDEKKLLTDRTAYLSFLEVQLERVSTACLTVQGYDGKFTEIESGMSTCNTRVNDLARVLKQAQDLAELAEKSFEEQNSAVRQRLTAAEGAARGSDETIHALSVHVDQLAAHLVEESGTAAGDRATEYCRKQVDQLRAEMTHHEAAAAEKLVKANSEASLVCTQQCSQLQSTFHQMLQTLKAELLSTVKASVAEVSGEVAATKLSVDRHNYAINKLEAESVTHERLTQFQNQMAPLNKVQPELEMQLQQQCNTMRADYQAEISECTTKLRQELAQQQMMMDQTSTELRKTVSRLDTEVTSAHRELGQRVDSGMSDRSGAANKIQTELAHTQSELASLKNRLDGLDSSWQWSKEQLTAQSDTTKEEVRVALESSRVGLHAAEEALRDDTSREHLQTEELFKRVRSEISELHKDLRASYDPWEGRMEAVEQQVHSMEHQRVSADKSADCSCQKHLVQLQEQVEEQFSESDATAERLNQMLRKSKGQLDMLDSQLQEYASDHERGRKVDHEALAVRAVREYAGGDGLKEQIQLQASLLLKGALNVPHLADQVFDMICERREESDAKHERAGTKAIEVQIERQQRDWEQQQADARTNAKENWDAEEAVRRQAAADAAEVRRADQEMWDAEVLARRVAQEKWDSEEAARRKAEADGWQSRQEIEAARRQEMEAARQKEEADGWQSRQEVEAARRQEMEAARREEEAELKRRKAKDESREREARERERNQRQDRSQPIVSSPAAKPAGLHDKQLPSDASAAVQPAGLHDKQLPSDGSPAQETRRPELRDRAHSTVIGSPAKETRRLELRDRAHSTVIDSPADPSPDENPDQSNSGLWTVTLDGVVQAFGGKRLLQPMRLVNFELLLKDAVVSAAPGQCARIAKQLWTLLEKWVGASQLACACALVAVDESDLEDKFRLVFELLYSYDRPNRKVVDVALLAFLQVTASADYTKKPELTPFSKTLLNGRASISFEEFRLAPGSNQVVWWMDKFCRSVRLELGLPASVPPSTGGNAAHAEEENPISNRTSSGSPREACNFDSVDVNHDGVIDREEWMASVSSRSGRTRKPTQQPAAPARVVADVDMVKRVVRRIFRKADRYCRNGKLTVSEMRTFLKGSRYEQFVQWLTSSAGLVKFDSDRNGSLDRAEVAEAVSQYIEAGGSFELPMAPWSSELLKAVNEPPRTSNGASEVTDEDSLTELIDDVNRLVGSMGDTIDVGLSIAAVESAGKESLQQVYRKYNSSQLEGNRTSQQAQGQSSKSDDQVKDQFESAANQAYIEVLQSSLRQSQQSALQAAVVAATAVERTAAPSPAVDNQQQKALSSQMEQTASSVAQLAGEMNQAQSRWQADAISVEALSQQIETCQNMIAKVAVGERGRAILGRNEQESTRGRDRRRASPSRSSSAQRSSSVSRVDAKTTRLANSTKGPASAKKSTNTSKSASRVAPRRISTFLKKGGSKPKAKDAASNHSKLEKLYKELADLE